MKLKRLKVKNFRQFYGEHEIEFSVCKSKNITLIHAENGVGKTAFLNSILWCLFETTTPNFKDNQVLLNHLAKANGDKNLYVSLEFEESGESYLAQRSKNTDGITFRVFNVKEDGYIEVDNPSLFINSVIPRDMAQYFFFQGEGIGSTTGKTGGAKIRNAIQEILGFTLAEQALKDLTTIRKEYEKHLSAADKNGEVKNLHEKKASIAKTVELHNKIISENNGAILIYKEKLSSIENKLINCNSEVIKLKHKQRKEAESSLELLESRLKNAKLIRYELLNEFGVSVFAHKLSDKALDFIDEQELKGTIPAPFNEQLVRDILDLESCICGCQVKPGTEQFSNIQKLLKKAADPKLMNRVSKARAQLGVIKAESNRAKSRFTEINKSIHDSESEILKLKLTLKELSLDILSSDVDEIKKLESERELLKSKLNNSNKMLGGAEMRLSQDLDELSKIQSQISRLGNFSGEMKKYQDLISATDTVFNIISDTLNTAKKDIEVRIIKKVNAFLSSYVRQAYKAKIDPNTFEIRLVDSKGIKVAESDGQALLLSLTFISALISLARERKDASGQILTPGAIAPFVIDAPFGVLDNKYKGNVAKSIPESVEQVILLLSSSHWEGSVEKNIREKVGAEYNLVLEVEASGEGKDSDNINILGEEYPTVRYSAGIDRTVIEKVGIYA